MSDERDAAPTPQADGGVMPAPYYLPGDDGRPRNWGSAPPPNTGSAVGGGVERDPQRFATMSGDGRPVMPEGYEAELLQRLPLVRGGTERPAPAEARDDLAGLSAREKEKAIRVSAARIGMAIEAHKDDPGHEVYAKSTVYQWQAVLARLTPAASRPAVGPTLEILKLLRHGFNSDDTQVKNWSLQSAHDKLAALLDPRDDTRAGGADLRSEILDILYEHAEAETGMSVGGLEEAADAVVAMLSSRDPQPETRATLVNTGTPQVVSPHSGD